MSPAISKKKTRGNNGDNVSETTPSRDTKESESLTNQDFEDLSNKIERNVSKKLKEQSDAQNALWKMLNEVRSQIDTLAVSKVQVPRIRESLTEQLIETTNMSQGYSGNLTPVREMNNIENPRFEEDKNIR